MASSETPRFVAPREESLAASQAAASQSGKARRVRDPRRTPIGKGTPGPLGDSYSVHTLSNGDPVVVRRTARRTSGLSAFWEKGQAIVAVPARLSLEDESYWIPRMVTRLEENRLKLGSKVNRDPGGDGELMQRCLALSRRYLGGRAVPESVRWVTNQNGRWGSATPARKSIRISHHVHGMPAWVVDYVLLHELTHLIHPNHSAAFWDELSGYPKQLEAKAFLAGASFASSRNITGMSNGLDGWDDSDLSDEPEGGNEEC